MGANGQAFLQETERIINENSPELFPEPTERELFIEKLKARRVRLSYSSLKKLDSPVNFMNHFLEKKEAKSKSQNLGSLIDCRVLTPEVFESTFIVLDAVPTTDLQNQFCDEVLRLMGDNKLCDDVFDEAYKTCYSRGQSSSVEHLKPYILALAENKEIVSRQLYDKAISIADNLLKQDDIISELGCIEETQKVLEFEYKGWSFKSFLDTWSPNLFHDLKYAADCTCDKFEFDIRKYGYDIQFGLYDIGLEVLGLSRLPVFKFIVFDDKKNYSIITVDRTYINFARRKVEFYIDCLEKMIAENAYSKSYNYFRSKTTISKPNWVKGMDYEIFSTEDPQD